jgi:aryl-alcohol dehydrogenase-like predicted oxidoreductase
LPTDKGFYQPDVFQVMEDMVTASKIRNYGVSVEKVEEGLKAIEYPGVASVQLIYNIFRKRPAHLSCRKPNGVGCYPGVAES